jgi:hypothetical protein
MNSENGRSRMEESSAESTEAKEDESSTGRIWAAGFHHVMACSHLAGILKLTKCFFNFQIYFLGLGKPQITETMDAESVDTGACLY